MREKDVMVVVECGVVGGCGAWLGCVSVCVWYPHRVVQLLPCAEGTQAIRRCVVAWQRWVEMDRSRCIKNQRHQPALDTPN